MKKFAILVLIPGLLLGCGGTSDEADYEAEAAAAAPVLLEVDPPAPIEVPERRDVTADDDWAARVHNKNIEVLEVMNIINPIAAYIVVGFEKYGDRFSETLQ